MITYAEYATLLEKLEHLGKEMERIRELLLEAKPDAEKGDREAWDNLVRLSEEISRKWEGPSAAQEIRVQRNKGY